jgi:hypothetical protein
MNLQIHPVINDTTGVTGLAIVDVILAGERDGAELAKLREPHIKADIETIRNHWKATGGPSICLPSVNREICTASTSSRS